MDDKKGAINIKEALELIARIEKLYEQDEIIYDFEGRIDLVKESPGEAAARETEALMKRLMLKKD